MVNPLFCAYKGCLICLKILCATWYQVPPIPGRYSSINWYVAGRMYDLHLPIRRGTTRMDDVIPVLRKGLPCTKFTV